MAPLLDSTISELCWTYGVLFLSTELCSADSAVETLNTSICLTFNPADYLLDAIECALVIADCVLLTAVYASVLLVELHCLV